MSLKDTLKKAKQLDTATRKLRRQSISTSDIGDIGDKAGTRNKNSLSNLSKHDIVNISASRQTIKPRNYLALNPLLQKSGIHEKEDVDIARRQRRRETKQKLRQTNWLTDI